MRQGLNLLQQRAYTTVQPRRSPRFRELVRVPVFKTLFLTIVFGSVVVESTRGRKDIEALRAAYGAKFRILREVAQKIANREPVDVAQELSIANSITRNKYNSVTDVELDAQLDAFLKLVEDPEDLVYLSQVTRSPAGTALPVVEAKDTKLFL